MGDRQSGVLVLDRRDILDARPRRPAGAFLMRDPGCWMCDGIDPDPVPVSGSEPVSVSVSVSVPAPDGCASMVTTGLF